MTRRVAISVFALLGLAACDQRPVDVTADTYRMQWSKAAPVGFARPFYAVGGSGPNDVYVLSPDSEWDYDVVWTYPAAQLLRFDGSDWRTVDVDLPSFASNVDIWASAPDDIWVAHDSLVHFDGSEWTRHPVRAYAVHGTGPDNILAIGSSGLYHYNGRSWKRLYEPQYAGGDAVWAGAPDFVVFEASHRLYWIDGAEFHEYDPPAAVTDIWGSSKTDVWAVGEVYYPPGGVILHFDGAEWSEWEAGDLPQLRAVWGSGQSDVYAAGGGRVFHFDGTTWSESFRTSRGLYGVWGSGGDDVYAVGSDGRVARFDGGQWGWARPLVPNRVNAVWGESRDRFFALEHYGGVYRYEDGYWEEVSTLWNAEAVWGASMNDVFVANGRRIEHFDGSAWTTAVDSTWWHQHDMWGRSGDDVFTVGEGGGYHFDGSVWTPMPFPPTYGIVAVSGDADGTVFAVGPYGVILRYRNGSWRRVESGTVQHLTDVWVAGPGRAVAVGPGVVLQFDGEVWNAHLIGSAGKIRAVAGTGPSDAIVIGGGDGFWFDGSLWNWAPTTDDIEKLEVMADGSILGFGRGVIHSFEGVQ